MGLLDRFRKKPKERLQDTVEDTALSALIIRMSEMRGTRVSPSDPTPSLPTGTEGIDAVVEAARDVHIANTGGELRILGRTATYRSARKKK